MAWGVRSYLVGSIVLGVLGVLAGCSGSMFFAERESWRHDAEVQCLGTGMIKEGAGITRMQPIRRPGAIEGPNAAAEPYDFRRPYGVAPAPTPPRYSSPRAVGSPREDFSPEPYEHRPLVDPPAALRNGSSGITGGPLREPPAPPSARETVVPLGPSRDGGGSFTPVALSPPATLACPIVSELERWIGGAVQPAAMRWFGSPVAEIRQISAYSCRGMNGNPRASISEHA